MPGPEIIEGEGVVFAFVDTCLKQKDLPEAERHGLSRNGDRRQERSSWPVSPV